MSGALDCPSALAYLLQGFVCALRRLDFEEFYEQLWYILVEWELPNQEAPDDGGKTARARFAKLDANG